MSTRYGKTINGQHFSICESARLSSLRINHFIDGKRVSAHEYARKLAEARAAHQVLDDTEAA